MSTDPRTLARRWARATALTLALSASLAGAPALADTASPTAEETAAEETASPAQVIADALAESPVYVDSSYDGAYAVEARERVVTAIEQHDLNLYVIVVPLVEGDTWSGESEALASAVHDRMGGGERHFLIYDRRGDMEGHDLGTDPDDWSKPAFYGALAASYKTMGGQQTLPTLVEAAVEAALADDPEAAYETAQQAYYDRVGEPPTGNLMPARWWNPWIIGALVLALLAGIGVPLYRRLDRSRPGGLLGRRPAAPIAQHAAFDNADRAQLESLVERGGRDLIELGERLSSDTGVDPRHLATALDARDAAARVHDRMVKEGATLPDAVGVLVLLDLAEDALAGLRGPRRPCYANPLHGNDTRQTQWREFGGLRTIRVPLCPECARAVRDRRRPTVLPAEHEGRSVPYYEVPAERSVWAATGYGTLTDDLVERILRGGHRPAR
ncbi:hypothetical protein [Nocardiopsis sp. CC223A]|uniref:hypothetical protein n=1 Tax=Nocardiopsis sp. CC223A TaxID=3044051 RepID=UPI00278C63C3|nr:hypothetical protein [Nocardiopsis sp. CC223A]